MLQITLKKLAIFSRSCFAFLTTPSGAIASAMIITALAALDGVANDNWVLASICLAVLGLLASLLVVVLRGYRQRQVRHWWPEGNNKAMERWRRWKRWT